MVNITTFPEWVTVYQNKITGINNLWVFTELIVSIYITHRNVWQDFFDFANVGKYFFLS